MRVFRYLLGAALIIWAAGVSGQTITASGVIQDTDGNQWVNGSWSATLQSPNGPPMYLGTPIVGGTVGGVMDSTGLFTSTGQLYNTSTIMPTGAFYEFNICSQTTAPCSKFNVQIVTGAGLISAINANIVAPRFPAFLGALGYSDVENIATAIVGARYFNSNTGTLRYWTGSTWVNLGAAAGITSGTIDNTVIGGVIPSAGHFTVFTATNINGYTPLAGTNMFPTIVGESYQPNLTATSVNQTIYAAGSNPYAKGSYSFSCTVAASANTAGIVTISFSYTDAVSGNLFSYTMPTITLSTTAPTVVSPVMVQASNATSITTTTVLVSGSATFTKDCFVTAMTHH